MKMFKIILNQSAELSITCIHRRLHEWGHEPGGRHDG